MNTNATATQQILKPIIENIPEQKLSEQETAFLIDIYNYSLAGVVKRYNRLRISKRKGNEMKEKLEKDDYIRTVDIFTLRGRIKLFEFSDKGKHALALLGYTPKSYRKGGVEHQYWQYKVTQYFLYKGYKVTENYALGNGKEVDIVVEKNGKKIAIDYIKDFLNHFAINI